MKTHVIAAALTAAWFGTVAHATTVVVHPGDLDGWATSSSSTASTAFTAGPPTPPLGSGSVQLSVGADGDSAAQVRNTLYNGAALSSIVELSYSTFVTQDGVGGQAPYIILNIDLDGNGTTDDQLFFEPVYQTGVYGGDPVPNQGATAVGVWQTWNARIGGWWALSASTFGPPLVTLDTYMAARPGAKLASPLSGVGSVRVVAGFGAGAWPNFVGSVDAFHIKTASADVTYDFELATPLTAIGFQSPMDQAVAVKKKSNRVLPFKMQIVDQNGVPQGSITPPVIEIQFGSTTLGGVSGDDLLSSGKGDEGNQFSYVGDGVWQFNLSSKQFTAPGVYTVTAVSGNSSEYTLNTIVGQFTIE